MADELNRKGKNVIFVSGDRLCLAEFIKRRFEEGLDIVPTGRGDVLVIQDNQSMPVYHIPSTTTTPMTGGMESPPRAKRQNYRLNQYH